MAKTNYQELTQYNSPNYTPHASAPAVFGMSREIIGIIYHWWGDPNQNPQFMNIVNYLCRANGNTSAHLVGETNRIAWIVNAQDVAWHAGSARGNTKYVGYECNPRLHDGDYQTMGEFHYDMEKAYGKTLEIRTHNEFVGTQCSPIDRERIRRIADGLHYQDTAPAPNPTKPVPAAVKLPAPLKFKAKLGTTNVWDLTTNPNYKAVTTLAKGSEFVAFAKIDFNNATYYVTEYSFGKGLKNGVNSVDLERIEEVAPQPEWIRNLKWDDKIGKLSVLPAGGTKVLNLTTITNINDDIIPKGTQVDVAGFTLVGGKKYYISSYSKTKGLPWGIPADTLGVPVVEPEKEKPEWLKNLKDITDKTFYTRSDTPILSTEDYSTVRTVPINTPLFITHSTHMLENDYMVIEGQKEMVAPIYLSDTPIEQPDNDLEKRVGLIEAFISVFIEAFSEFIKTIKGKW